MKLTLPFARHRRPRRLAALLTLILAVTCAGTAIRAADGVSMPKFGAVSMAASPLADVEQFDVSGLPGTPASFVQQQLHVLRKHHVKGDVNSAIAIQRKLGAAYREQGDIARAELAERRARAAEVALASHAKPATGARSAAPAEFAAPPIAAKSASPAPATAPSRSPAPKPPPVKPAFTGRFYHMHSASALEKWDFNADGTFLHSWIGGGGGASSRTSERGTFRVEAGQLVLDVDKVVNAFAASTGSHQSTLGASTGGSTEVRRLRLTLRGNDGSGGLMLDDVEFKVRSW